MENKDIFTFVKNGELEKLKSVYDLQRIDLNMKDEEGTPLLICAVKDYSGKIVEWLLNQGVDADALDKNNKTALMWAAENRSNYLIKTLLTAGAYPNLKDKDGKTALRYFVDESYDELKGVYSKRGHEDTFNTIDLFYSFGGDCLLKDNKGVSAGDVLLNASSYFSEQGYVITKFTPKKSMIVPSMTQLYFLAGFIISGNEVAGVNLAKEIEDVNDKTEDGETALSLAASRGRSKVVEVLLKRGADVNLPDRFGDTPLMLAASNGFVKVVSLLLEYGADVNKVNDDNETALMQACCPNDPYMNLDDFIESAKLLLDAGANKDIVSVYGTTALENAEDFGDQCLVDLLEKYEPKKFVPKNIHLLDDRLIQAVLSENSDKLEYSIKHLDDEGFYLEKNGKKEISVGLNTYNFDAHGKTLFDHAIENKSIKCLKFLLWFGMNVNHKNKNGQTPLYVAHKEDYSEAINLLLSYGADRSSVRRIDILEFQEAKENSKGKWLSTSLIQAVLKENKDELVSLLEAGENASLTDSDGKTLFDYAIENNRLKGLFYLVCLNRDINFGVDVNLKNKNGQTPLAKAREVGFKDAEELLLAFGAKTVPQKITSQRGSDYCGNQRDNVNQYC